MVQKGETMTDQDIINGLYRELLFVAMIARHPSH